MISVLNGNGCAVWCLRWPQQPHTTPVATPVYHHQQLQVTSHTWFDLKEIHFQRINIDR